MTTEKDPRKPEVPEKDPPPRGQPPQEDPPRRDPPLDAPTDPDIERKRKLRLQ